MSISDNYAPDKSLGNSSTVEFTGNWSPLVASYFKLALESVATGVQTLQTQGDDYTLTFDDDGYIATMDTAPSSDYYVVRYREIEQNQTVPLRTSKGFQGYVHENALDKLTAIDQDQQDAISRTLKFQVGATGITNAILPAPVDGYGIVWDGTDGSMKNTAASLAALESSAVIVTENIANINTVAANDANITLAATLAPLTEEISIIADNIDDLQVVADALSDSIASGITYDHTTSGLAATNVQTAIDELASEKLNALFASQAEAEAGTAEDKPMNALRTKQAIAALVAASGWVPIKTVTAANVTSVDFVNGSGGVVLNGTYKAYIVAISNLVPQSDTTALWMRTSSNGGSTYDNGASNYYGRRTNELMSTAYNAEQSSALTEMPLTQGAIGNTDRCFGQIMFGDPTIAEDFLVKADIACNDESGSLAISYTSTYARRSAADVDAIRFLMSSGNITSGTFTLYGLKGA